MKKYIIKATASFPGAESKSATLTLLPNFELKIKPIREQNTIVPLGISNFNGDTENQFIEFEIEILKHGIDEFSVEILHDDKVIYTVYSAKQTLDEVIITAKGTKTKKENIEEEEETPMNYPIGKYSFKWDGFDSNGIYDSSLFTSGKLKARLKGKIESVEKTTECEEFSFEYKEVQWVDAKIDKNAKRIDITLRVNLKDGGENGTEKDCYETGSGSYASITKHCPWEKIPKKYLTSGTPLKTRIKSFADLEKLAIDGLNYHWGRNQNHFIAKNVEINGEKYQIFVNSINVTEKAMDDVSLIFNTNRSWMRSGNPGTVEDPISFIGNIISREAICYNVGYIKHSFGWDYKNVNKENIAFKETSAHEIGHTILKAYGGTFYSYGHKGSVNTVTQSENSNATNYPTIGEIDLMKYFKNWIPYNQRDKMVASKKDILSLVWLTKIEMK
ncbi:hypothetical protein J2Q11_13775 [Tenacibaculum finnmarkense genomovar finnmarkense]|uniref:hypothetical protein n=1 Tax=Tenacibaculum finnmarkense TaxID=2781243 RepID=UPI001E5E6406|nr:hypothetical protein [Tenacibaculum finnmarkense]MCD8418795.1 hypothetical protein [Tenacibaculum finnmarkense genomovar finnmarkense]MCG8187093.1 hypothetical protein [Tenacibaculum finnmarkense genomovar finnmarkense]MCG8203658.1 hypothetical protein [Tenacibaculum finnmarkense genomovar finnmarkense]MCG8211135.1 hypothetical protein [Tenacibaculum finnmarkense genomovar finnmarkense]MCG8213886.1 hypothetical protein [Tenacibaculum finnmarkense genomovar finnmarkense]